jgi:hypothetical protein
MYCSLTSSCYLVDEMTFSKMSVGKIPHCCFLEDYLEELVYFELLLTSALTVNRL